MKIIDSIYFLLDTRDAFLSFPSSGSSSTLNRVRLVSLKYSGLLEKLKPIGYFLTWF